MKQIVKISSFVVVIIFTCLEAADARRFRCLRNRRSNGPRFCNSQFPSKFAQTLPRHTRQFLNQYCCEIVNTKISPRTQGFARFTWAFLRCRDLYDNTIATVLCSETCTNPKTNLNLSGYIVRPYLRERHFEDRWNCRDSIELPVSCKCVPKQ